MKILAVLALSLSLSGCWVGKDFYAPAESVRAIEPGKYKIHREYSRVNDDPDKVNRGQFNDATDVKISYAPDGRALVRSNGEIDASIATLVEFDKAAGTYIAQIDMTDTSDKAGVGIGQAVFALIRVTPRGYDLAVPVCNDYHRIASRPRIYAKGPLFGLPTCRYNTRADLEAAMVKYAEDPIRWTSYWRKEKQ